MSNNTFLTRSKGNIKSLKKAGTYKQYKHLDTPMDAHSKMCEAADGAGGDVIVMSSNNYLGLANHPKVINAAEKALHKYGAGTASVRFICGTMTIHEELERKIAEFHSQPAALTYSSCWSANTGLFAVICQPGDVLISDSLNHASIIDGCRLVNKNVIRTVYRHSDMEHLEKVLKEHKDAPVRFIVTDGVFSMEGDIANLPALVELAEKYDAVLIVDDSHGVGVMGKNGRGTAEHFGLEDKIDILTSTLGKSLGGAAGGYVAADKDVIDMLIQASRPHIFSNSISPATAGSGIAALEVIKEEPHRVKSLHSKVAFFRKELKNIGYNPLDGESAIIPIIVGETAFAIKISEKMLEKGIYVTGFGFPVVPEGAARIRVQISDALEMEDLQKALDVFAEVGREVGLIKGAA